MGSLQELDQPPILAPVTKAGKTLIEVAAIAGGIDEAFTVARRRHRGPIFVDVPMDQLFAASVGTADGWRARACGPDRRDPSPRSRLLAAARRPVLIIGTDVWSDRAEGAALRLVEDDRHPVVTNGMGRGIIPGGHPLLVTKARRCRAVNGADLVVVVGTPLDFRLGYGVFGGKDGVAPAQVVHLADRRARSSTHATLAGSAYGDLSLLLDGVREAPSSPARPDPTGRRGPSTLRDQVAATQPSATPLLLTRRGRPDPPGPHLRRAACRGSPTTRWSSATAATSCRFAGKFVEPKRPGGWLDPGPYGCLGAGLGAAIAARIARPSAQVVLLLGDGAAGFSLMDVDTLVRHDLPVVMVMGNNSAWGLEKGPMQMLYGYDVVADLAPQTPYDEVVKALGGAGETVSPTRSRSDRPSTVRSPPGVPYLVNVITDVEAAYPRTTFGI